jgi:hypothetical protein
LLVQAIFDALTDRELSDEEPRGDGLRNSRTVGGGGTVTFTWDIASGLPVVLDDGNQYVYSAGLVSMKQSGSWVGILLPGRRARLHDGCRKRLRQQPEVVRIRV